MLASEMKVLSTQCRNENEEFNKQWKKMQQEIEKAAREGLNYCTLVYGNYNEQLVEKLKENGFRVMRKMDLFPHVTYGMTNCLTQYVVW